MNGGKGFPNFSSLTVCFFPDYDWNMLPVDRTPVLHGLSATYALAGNSPRRAGSHKSVFISLLNPWVKLKKDPFTRLRIGIATEYLNICMFGNNRH